MSEPIAANFDSLNGPKWRLGAESIRRRYLFAIERKERELSELRQRLEVLNQLEVELGEDEKAQSV